MAKNATPVRGTRDILPDEMIVRDRLEAAILKTYTTHGFQRIETPALESLELLLDSEGGENLKMLFTILKRGEKLQLDENASVMDLCDIGLRYDLTLPLSRFYSNNRQHLPMPFKAIQIGNVYRAERPQKGRFRSFKQCDIDIIGDGSWQAEVELIDTTAKALQEIGFENFTVRINDRRILTGMMAKAGYETEQMGAVSVILDKLDKIGAQGVLEELSAMEQGPEGAQRLLDLAEGLSAGDLKGQGLDETAVEGLVGTMEAMEQLSQGKYQVSFDPTLVRGMGYYTGMIFEVSYGPYGFSIAGGGRYDGLIGKFSKQSVPAVGFSIGFERIVTILQEEGRSRSDALQRLALLYDETDPVARVVEKADQLREGGFAVSVMKAKKKLGKQIGQLEEAGFTHLWIFGRDEEVQTLGGPNGS
ncbi:histidine--tRNA ligase [Alkalibacter rhizosphaerae]|uniref:Histidine--tRNA ligase n=1 Tax=Alkalibacter rhizosphaerae TaxID=2815577 RepID=A0A974XD35_9FIRM|nr:histidine--tRNA ligase [Alkalibacter rhizosphaerae]QSX07511.1 histidine--tRNA ligase [Alkalibacter rhizosphaerae]